MDGDNEFKLDSDLSGAGDHFDLAHSFGPSVPPGYPRGFRDEPDMGFEWRRRPRAGEPKRRGFWARLFGPRQNDEMGYDGRPGAPMGPGAPMALGAMGGRPGAPGGYGGQASPGTRGAQQALKRLDRAMHQAQPGNTASLASLQSAFDNFRYALKAAFPTGGPHGPVG
jgi:hypothetical protein